MPHSCSLPPKMMPVWRVKVTAIGDLQRHKEFAFCADSGACLNVQRVQCAHSTGWALCTASLERCSGPVGTWTLPDRT
jgi:hypothetical protein